MARIGDDNNYGANWQKDKKSVAGEMFDDRMKQADRARNTDAAKSVGNAIKDAAALHENKNAQNLTTAETAHANSDLPNTKQAPKVQEGNNVQKEVSQRMSQSVERTRTETQQAAAIHSDAAGKQFVNAKEDANRLNNALEGRFGEAGHAKAATKTAVAGKSAGAEANLMQNNVRQPVEKLAAKTREAIEQQEARQKAENLIKLTRNGTQNADGANAKKDGAQNLQDPKLAQNPNEAFSAQVAGQPAAALGAKNSDKPNSASNRSDKSAKLEKSGKNEGQTKSAKTQHSGGKESMKGLGDLIGGFGAGTDGNFSEEFSGDAGSRAVATHGNKATDAAKPKELCDSDSGLQVFNEFDSARAGIETVKAKAQLFSKIEKKLSDIKKVDSDVEEKLTELFKSVPLSERIVGELAEDVKLARFLGTVYGGGLRG